jgi:hypothetical protein
MSTTTAVGEPERPAATDVDTPLTAEHLELALADGGIRSVGMTPTGPN